MTFVCRHHLRLAFSSPRTRIARRPSKRRLPSPQVAEAVGAGRCASAGAEARRAAHRRPANRSQTRAPRRGTSRWRAGTLMGRHPTGRDQEHPRIIPSGIAGSRTERCGRSSYPVLEQAIRGTPANRTRPVEINRPWRSTRGHERHRHVVGNLHRAHQQRVGLDPEIGLANLGLGGQSPRVAEIFCAQVDYVLSGLSPDLQRAAEAISVVGLGRWHPQQSGSRENGWRSTLSTRWIAPQPFPGRTTP